MKASSSVHHSHPRSSQPTHTTEHRRTTMMMRLALALAAVPAGLVVGVHHFKELGSVEDLQYLNMVAPDSGVAGKHLLLGFGTSGACFREMRTLGFPQAYAHLGEEFETGEVAMDRHDELARLYNVSMGSCNTFVFVPKGGKVGEDFDLLRADSEMQLNNWFYEHVRAKLAVTNDLPFDVEVRWENTATSTAPEALIDIPAGKTADIDTFESHHLRFFKREGRAMDPVLRVRMTGQTALKLSDYVHNDMTAQCSNPDDCESFASDEVQLSQEDMETWRGRDFENRMRVLRNEQQPATKPRYTALGFKKTRVPDDIFKIMWDRYKTGEEITEPWPKSDCHTNFFESPSTMIYLTDHEKQRIFKGVKPMLSEWAGGVKLVETSCYGVRLYHNGSWLREHVDTGDTHIISAIMNIDQDVREDWHLSFIDHNGDRHYIALQPQDMVFYESASCLHGRPAPFNGNFFANTFVHFKVV